MNFLTILYGIAGFLIIGIIVHVIINKKVSLGDTIALLSIVISAILAIGIQNNSLSNTPTPTQLSQTNTPSSTDTPNWAIIFEYRFPAGFWSVGTHEYTIESDCPIIDSSGLWTNQFRVSESAQLIPGDIYLRIAGLKDKHLPEGSQTFDVIHPMQTTSAGFVIFEVTQSDTELAFRECVITIMWDGGEPKQLTPNLPFQN
jgi:hypothetical protein